jgi:hypothetical protein
MHWFGRADLSTTPSRLRRRHLPTGQLRVIAEIEDNARGTRPIVPARLIPLLVDFLAIKSGDHATRVEKKVYSQMSIDGLVDRLLRKRPLMFMTAADQYLLPCGADGAGAGLFDRIGSDHESGMHRLENLQSYDEMALSAMIGVSVPTHFINNGDRGNQAVRMPVDAVDTVGDSGDADALVAAHHARTGIYIAQVGARFERTACMEYRWMVVTEDQNTAAEGYGPGGNPLVLVRPHWDTVICLRNGVRLPQCRERSS